MKWECRQLQVEVRGLLGGKLPDHFVSELNRLGKDDWELVQAVGLQIGSGTTAAVVFMLKRELEP